ncbi:MAG: protein kinase [Candidatus Schekmanbacteria bacterium]|nr:protein kinase [Candidatus Schekmanbacteria bacterium]
MGQFDVSGAFLDFPLPPDPLLREVAEESDQPTPLLPPPPAADEGIPLGDRYVLVAEVGKGAMGRVVRAWDRELVEWIALKYLDPVRCGAEGVISRFRREVRLTRRLTHPNVIRIHDLGAVPPIVFLTMEYVLAPSLQQLIVRDGPLAAAFAASLALQIASGVEAAHALGIIHRDLKPRNVLVSTDGQIKVIDFGICKCLLPDGSAGGGSGDVFNVTREGVVIGTPGYLAPETVLDGIANESSDIYAFGVVLYEMLAGRPAHAGKTASEVIGNQLRFAPTRPSAIATGVDADLENLALVCMDKRPAQRPGTFREIVAELSGWRDHRKAARERRAAPETPVFPPAPLGAIGAAAPGRGLGSPAAAFSATVPPVQPTVQLERGASAANQVARTQVLAAMRSYGTAPLEVGSGAVRAGSGASASAAPPGAPAQRPGTGTGTPASAVGAAASEPQDQVATELLNQATECFRRRDLAATVANLKKLLAVAPAKTYAWRLLGMAQLEQGKLAEAEDALRKAVVGEPDDKAAQWTLAQVLYRKKSLADAAESLRGLLARWPDDGEAQHLLARCLYGLDQVADARIWLQRAARRLAANAVTQWELARMEAVHGDLTLAREALLRAVRLDRTYAVRFREDASFRMLRNDTEFALSVERLGRVSSSR